MKVGKAAAATAVAGLVLLGTAGSASALTLDLSGIGGPVKDTTNGVSELLGGTPEIPGVETPAHSVGTDGISVQVGDILDIQIGTNVPAAPASPALPATPALPGTDALPESPIKLPVASIPDMPDPTLAFNLISFWRGEVSGLAMSTTNSADDIVDSASSFTYRNAGMAVDLAGLASVRLMVASAYEQATTITDDTFAS